MQYAQCEMLSQQQTDKQQFTIHSCFSCYTLQLSDFSVHSMIILKSIYSTNQGMSYLIQAALWEKSPEFPTSTLLRDWVTTDGVWIGNWIY
jgi:hypothetical protein